MLHSLLEIAGRLLQAVLFVLNVLTAIGDLIDLGRLFSREKSEATSGEDLPSPKAVSTTTAVTPIAIASVISSVRSGLPVAASRA